MKLGKTHFQRYRLNGSWGDEFARKKALRDNVFKFLTPSLSTDTVFTSWPSSCYSPYLPSSDTCSWQIHEIEGKILIVYQFMRLWRILITTSAVFNSRNFKLLNDFRDENYANIYTYKQTLFSFLQWNLLIS